MPAAVCTNGNDRSDNDDDIVDVGLPNGNAAEGHVAAVTTGEGDREDGQQPPREAGRGEGRGGGGLPIDR